MERSVKITQMFAVKYIRLKKTLKYVQAVLTILSIVSSCGAEIGRQEDHPPQSL